jgi:hypothetical protein
MKNIKSINNTFFYILFGTILLSAVSLLQLVDIGMADLYYYTAVVLALVIGTVHVIALSKFFHTALPHQIRGGWWLSISIIFFSIVIIAIIYYYAGLNFQFMTFIIAFIIPLVCWFTYQYFLNLREV